MNAIIPRKTIAQMVAFRDQAVREYLAAFDTIETASAALSAARDTWRAAAGEHAGYSDSSVNEIAAFHNAVRLPDRDQWERTVVRLIDISCWREVIDKTDLHQLMDAQAKQELEDTLRWVPERFDYRRGYGESRQLVNPDEIVGIPAFTVDNVMASIERWASEADMVFRRGMANVFSAPDRRFRSHDGFKIGSRLILDYAFDTYLSASLNSSAENKLIDIERIFRVLEGQPATGWTSIAHVIRNERTGYGPRQSEHEGAYFRVRCFKNGNMHLWFTRDDLVEEVNRQLAAYYGEVIGDGMTREADPLKDRKLTPARHFGFFPTPPDAAARLIDAAQLYCRKDAPALRILEPSAGTGNLAALCAAEREGIDGWGRAGEPYRYAHHVDCIEIQPPMAKALENTGRYRRVWNADFLSMRPGMTGQYDRIVMNPPFDRERDIDHVTHAMDFLAPGGRLVAIMSAGTEFRETRKAIAFRDLLKRHRGTMTDLPSGSFAESGTYVNTIILKMTKEAT